MDLFAKFAAEVRTVDYCKNIVRRNYIYKGYDVYKSVSKNLNNFAYHAENQDNLHQATFENCGYGELAFLYALLHPEVEVIGIDDEEHIDVARNCQELPGNLRYEVK